MFSNTEPSSSACEQAQQIPAALEVWTSAINSGALILNAKYHHPISFHDRNHSQYLHPGASPSFADTARIGALARNHGHAAASIAAYKFGAENFRDEIAFPVRWHERSIGGGEVHLMRLLGESWRELCGCRHVSRSNQMVCAIIIFVVLLMQSMNSERILFRCLRFALFRLGLF